MVKKPTERRTVESFNEALWGLMREKYSAGPFDTPTISQLVRDLGTDWHYENVRKILAQERGLPMRFVEDCARIFGVTPTYFREYRLDQLCRALKNHPEVLTEFYDLGMDLAARYQEQELKSGAKQADKIVDNPSLGGS